MNGLPRLPLLPIVGGGYEPPNAEPSAASAAAAAIDARADQEVYAATVPVPAVGAGNPASPNEVAIFRTHAPWSGCDVCITPNVPAGGVPAAGGLISVFVYAVNKGVRALVASGRYFLAAGSGPFAARWVVAARGSAQSWEVSLMYTQTQAGTVTICNVDVSVVASNVNEAAPPDIGTELANQVYLSGNVSSVGTLAAGTQNPNAPELVALRGTNGAAAARWLQLHDTPTLAPAPGATPIMVWGLGAAIGFALPEVRVRYRARDKIQLVGSSTMATLTQVADCAITGLIR